jgi:hypothetical protein
MFSMQMVMFSKGRTWAVSSIIHYLGKIQLLFLRNTATLFLHFHLFQAHRQPPRNKSLTWKYETSRDSVTFSYPPLI